MKCGVLTLRLLKSSACTEPRPETNVGPMVVAMCKEIAKKACIFEHGFVIRVWQDHGRVVATSSFELVEDRSGFFNRTLAFVLQACFLQMRSLLFLSMPLAANFAKHRPVNCFLA